MIISASILTRPVLGAVTALSAIFVITLACTSAHANGSAHQTYFERVSSFPVYLNTSEDLETVAEIVDATDDGQTLVYSDSQVGGIGFVDIADPSNPQPAGFIDAGGEPTSVAVAGDYVLAAVNTSPDFVNPDGELLVIDLATHGVVRSFDLNGQPDSIAVSPDGRYAAIVIENERNEDLCVGGDFDGQEADEDDCEDGGGKLGWLPQLPSGNLKVLKMTAASVNGWQLRTVDLSGIADFFGEDAEAEFVDINRFNIAAVTLQENNHIILVDLRNRKVVHDFSAGSSSLSQVDLTEEAGDFGAGLILQTETTAAPLKREPDAITWLTPWTLATANEGDLEGGSRGFTIFASWGQELYNSGNMLEHLAARIGHYNEDRSKNKGTELEAVEYARFGRDRLLFVGSERSSFIAVFKLGLRGPELTQVLPSGLGPEGLKAIPGRNLFVTAGEEDDRDGGVRSVVSIYAKTGNLSYPTLVSENNNSGVPIPWAALSGLAVDPNKPQTLYSIYDSYYLKSRVFEIDSSAIPARITGEVVLRDTFGELSAVAPDQVNDDTASKVDDDLSVNLDPEGVATRLDGGFWVASEGAGTFDDPARPIVSRNLVVGTDSSGNITDVITLPQRLNDTQLRFGFEGVTTTMENGSEILYVAFQRAWTGAGDPADKARIGRYDTSTGDWTFAYYPLEPRQSPNSGWVGLSDLSYLGGDKFAVIERDNQAGPDARIKLITEIDAGNVIWRADSATPGFDVVSKSVVRDLIAEGDLTAPGGLILEKIEGLAVAPNGDVTVVNDNDGVDGSNGETQLIRIPALF